MDEDARLGLMMRWRRDLARLVGREERDLPRSVAWDVLRLPTSAERIAAAVDWAARPSTSLGRGSRGAGEAYLQQIDLRIREGPPVANRRP